MEPHVQIEGYHVYEFIGEGSFGSVYRARQLSTGQIVALKLLRLDNIDSATKARRIARFERETTLCAKLQHPYIVHLIDRGIDRSEVPYAVFEFIRGNTLHELLRQKGSLSPSKIKVLMGQVLEALAYAHEKGIIHRDLKPANIIAVSDNVQTHAKVLDFGIGGFLPSAKDNDYKSLTIISETLGTPSYAAPEQLRGEPPNTRSDLYAWGLVFLECLTGEPVITGDSIAEIFHKQLLFDDIPLPQGVSSHPVAGLLRRVLAKRWQERIRSAADLLNDYNKIHLDNLVGSLKPYVQTGKRPGGETMVGNGLMAGNLRRQLTVVCCSLSIVTSSGKESAIDVLDSLVQTHKSLCADIAAKYSGYLAGSLGDCIMLYFGYPESSDNDARLAVRTVLDLADECRQRSMLLEAQQQLKVDFRAGIHSGPVQVEPGSSPSGHTVNVALKLATSGAAGQVLLSNSSKLRLINHVVSEHVPDFRGFPTLEGVFKLIGERQREARTLLSTTPLVGRDKELQRIQLSCSTDLGGGSRAILIQGEAGIGKSALLEASLSELQHGGTRIVEARCLPEHRNNALYPVFELIRWKLGISELKSSGKAVVAIVEDALKNCGCNLETVFPVLCTWFSLPLPESYTLSQHPPQRQKELLFDVLRRLIMFQSRVRLCFAIEDLHWADQTTLEFMSFIIEYLDGDGLVLLATARPEFKVPWQDESLDTIHLGRLSIQEASDLLKPLLAGRNVSPEFNVQILERAGGVPLFIEELARTIIERYPVDDSGRLQVDKEIWSEDIPDTLIELLHNQILLLGPSRETAQLCSVIGREFDYRLLAEVSLLDAKLLQDDLDDLINTGIIVLKRGIDSSNYFFRHSLIREAAYDTIPESLKKTVHLQIAQILEEKFSSIADEQPGLLAHHFAGAHDFSRAIHFGTEAALTYVGLCSNVEAIRLSSRVLGWIENSGEDDLFEEKLQINGVMTQALMGTRGWADPEVKKRVDVSHTLLTDTMDSPRDIPALWSLMTYHYVSSNWRALHELTVSFLKYAETSDDPGLMVAAQTFLGLSHHGAGDYPQAEQALELVREMYQPEIHGNHSIRFGLDTRIWSSATLALVKWHVGKQDEAIHCAKEAICWAREINHIPSLCIGLLYYANLCLYMGDRAHAADVITELNTLANKYGLAGYQAYGQILECWLIGKDKETEAVLDMLQGMGCTAALTYYWSLLAEIYMDHACFGDAVQCINQSLSLYRVNDEFYYESELYRLHGDILLQQNLPRLEEATASYRQAADTARNTGMFFVAKAALHKLDTATI